MIDFSAQRTKMVDNQIRTTDVTSHSVQNAFLSVPREDFVPVAMRPLAYIDNDIEVLAATPVCPARFIMEPSPLAKLLQLAEVAETDVILDIGCATGYTSALLSRMGSSIVALESDETLAAQASETVSKLGYDNVAVVQGALEQGYAAEAPYDVIFVNGAVEVLPTALFDQLRDGGRLVVVEGLGNASQAKLYLRENGITAERPAFNTSVKPLPGFRKNAEFVF